MIINGRLLCDDCAKELTDEEAKFYVWRCEDCEGKAWSRMVTWLHGRRDPELDALTSDTPTVH